MNNPLSAPLLCIMGPTAAGKTDLAIALAEALDGELISVDSALVYRGLDIGAAKPDYPHHLIDIRDPAEPYSAADFARDAVAAIETVHSRGRLPILVGGTMLYFRALLMGLDEIPTSSPEVRAAVEAEAAERGWPALHAELNAVDPETAAGIHPNHSQRIGRALEVWRQTGVPISEWRRGGMAAPSVPHLPLVVSPAERRWLHERIARRLDLMMASGFLEEVRALQGRADLHADLPAMRAVGYRQLWGHLCGEYGLDEAVAQATAATRQLAKRQLTWLRSWPDAHWLPTGPEGGLLQATERRGDGPSETLEAAALMAWRKYLQTRKL